MINLIAKGLSTKIGKANAITSRDIISAMRDRGYKITGAELREIIHELRVKRGMLICGDSSGYYMAKNEMESIQQIKSMKSRIKAIQEACNGLQKAHQETFKQAQFF